MWETTFRFEGKHQSSKAHSENTSSRINIPHTLCQSWFKICEITYRF